MPASTTAMVPHRPTNLPQMNAPRLDRLGEEHEDGALLDLLVHQAGGHEDGHDERRRR